MENWTALSPKICPVSPDETLEAEQVKLFLWSLRDKQVVAALLIFFVFFHLEACYALWNFISILFSLFRCLHRKQSANEITCWSHRPGDVEVKVVGRVNGHVQVLVRLQRETTKTQGHWPQSNMTITHETTSTSAWLRVFCLIPTCSGEAIKLMAV